MKDRWKQMAARLRAADIPAAVIHTPQNMRYLTGYTGEGCLLLCAGGAEILTDFRYVEQAQRETDGLPVAQCGGSAIPPTAIIGERLKQSGISTLGLEEDYLTVSEYRKLKEGLDGVALRSVSGMALDMRAVKDEAEIALIERACQISCEAFERMLKVIKPGMTEKQVQIELDGTMLRLGADCVGFDTIACAGLNGSLPHATPSMHALAPGELLTLDFGAEYRGYKADMTRTLAISSISRELREIYDTVLEAQEMALSRVKSGVVCKALDAAVREFIEKKYPGRFGHGLGHGVGLNIHEQPGLNSRNDLPLQAGQVVTIEPGIYVPGLGGCRIEDTVVVTKDGYRNLIDAPKHLITI